jgi:hypothetical protein
LLKDQQGLTRSAMSFATLSVALTASSRANQNPRLSSNQAMVDALLATSFGTLPKRVAI